MQKCVHVIDSRSSSAGRWFSWNIIPYFCRKLGKMLQNLSSAAVVITALRVNDLAVSLVFLHLIVIYTQKNNWRILKFFWLYKIWENNLQSNFASDRITTMQFSKKQNEMYRSLVTIQYHTKCTNPLYPKFTSKKRSTYNFCCNLYLVITYVLILTTDKCSHAFISHCSE